MNRDMGVPWYFDEISRPSPLLSSSWLLPLSAPPLLPPPWSGHDGALAGGLTADGVLSVPFLCLRSIFFSTEPGSQRPSSLFPKAEETTPNRRPSCQRVTLAFPFLLRTLLRSLPLTRYHRLSFSPSLRLVCVSQDPLPPQASHHLPDQRDPSAFQVTLALKNAIHSLNQKLTSLRRIEPGRFIDIVVGAVRTSRGSTNTSGRAPRATRHLKVRQTGAAARDSVGTLPLVPSEY